MNFTAFPQSSLLFNPSESSTLSEILRHNLCLSFIAPSHWLSRNDLDICPRFCNASISRLSLAHFKILHLLTTCFRTRPSENGDGSISSISNPRLGVGLCLISLPRIHQCRKDSAGRQSIQVVSHARNRSVPTHNARNSPKTHRSAQTKADECWNTRNPSVSYMSLVQLDCSLSV